MALTVGILSSTTAANPYVQAFRDRLTALGWADGANVDVVAKHADGNLALLDGLANDLLRENPNVIMAGSTPAIRAIRRAMGNSTPQIPIVMGITGDPRVAADILNVNRPQGNVTGMWDHVDLQQENQLAILHDVIGGNALRVGVLINNDNPGKRAEFRSLRAVKLRGVNLNFKRYNLTADLATIGQQITDAFNDAKNAAAGNRQAMIVLGDPVLGLPAVAQVIRAQAAAAPPMITMYGASEAAEGGGLMSYGPSHRKVMERAADYVDMILRGASPGDLPLAQPMPAQLELVVKLSTYNAMGLNFLTPQFIANWQPRQVP
ncbi:MAG TPA: ABC transporter substrate-binding protein [Chloroflexota bacterium]|nr:ABC transporter substrate-binding protein [Chloroflexota bacterium]